MNCKVALIIGVVGLGFVAGEFAIVRADKPEPGECRVSMAQLPAAVARTLTQEASGGQVGEIDMKIGDHKATYEADVVINKLPYEITIAMNGTLLKKHLDDMDLTLNQLPAPVQAAIKQESGNGKVSEIGEHFFDDGDAFYKATVKIGEHAYKLKVLPDGTLLKMKLKEKEHGDHEDGDHDHADKDHRDHGDHGHADKDHGDHDHHKDKDRGDHGDND
jgi:hypothetical protein